MAVVFFFMFLANCLSHSVVFSGSVDLELLLVSVNCPCQSNVALAVFTVLPAHLSVFLILYLVFCTLASMYLSFLI